MLFWASYMCLVFAWERGRYRGMGDQCFLFYYIIYRCIWIICHLSRVHGMIKQKMSQIVSRQTHNVLHSDDERIKQHYTASIKCCKNILLQRQKLRSLTLLMAKLLYFICYTLWIDWFMSFGLEQEGGSLITPMALAPPLHPINSRSMNKRRNLWVGRCVPVQKLSIGEAAPHHSL